MVALTPGALTSHYDSRQIHMINGTQLVTRLPARNEEIRIYRKLPQSDI